MLDNIAEKEVLPTGEEDKVIPTRIHRLDLHIQFLHEQLDALQNQLQDANTTRMELLARARECHITQDSEYKIIELPIYPKKHVDVEALKRLAPDKYAFIQQNIYSRLQDKLVFETQKAMSFISQADVKALIRDKALLVQIIPEPKEPAGYETAVVKIGEQ